MGKRRRVAAFKWRQFAGEVILWAVRWYCRYAISYRELEEMLGERGVAVDQTTIYRWVQRYAPSRSARPGSGRVGAPSQFSDSTTASMKAACTRPPRPQSVPATHSAEFCLVREKTATLYRVTTPADPVLVHGNRLCGAKGTQPVPLRRRLEIRSGR